MKNFALLIGCMILIVVASILARGQTLQQISTGTVANDHTGDSLRAAFIKVNSNFAQLQTLITNGINYNLTVVTNGTDTATLHFTNGLLKQVTAP